MERHIIENGIKYELKGEQYYPIFSEVNTSEHHIGKYGQLHLTYIKQHKGGIYTTLLTDCALFVMSLPLTTQKCKRYDRIALWLFVSHAF